MSQIQNNFSPKAQGERARKKEETKGAFHLRKKPRNFGGSKSGISDR